MDPLATLESVRAAVPVAKLTSFHPIGLVDEYVRFLTLKMLQRDIDRLPPALSPSHPVDTVWHTHMLLPHEYIHTCQALLQQTRGSVKLFKHSPEPRGDHKRYERTLELYEKVFGVAPNSKLWPNENTASSPTMAGLPRTSTTPDNQIHSLQVFVKTLKGETVTLTVQVDATVSDLKNAIQESYSVPPDQFRLIYAGKQLEDGRTLRECGVRKNPTLHLVERLRGC